jgi:hypothetical protein
MGMQEGRKKGNCLYFSKYLSRKSTSIPISKYILSRVVIRNIIITYIIVLIAIKLFQISLADVRSFPLTL